MPETPSTRTNEVLTGAAVGLGVPAAATFANKRMYEALLNSRTDHPEEAGAIVKDYIKSKGLNTEVLQDPKKIGLRLHRELPRRGRINIFKKVRKNPQMYKGVMQQIAKAQLMGGGAYLPTSDTIVLPEGPASTAISLHEAGHAADRKLLGKNLYKHLARGSMLLPGAGLLYGSYEALSGDPERQRRGVIAAALSGAPLLAREGSASLRATAAMAKYYGLKNALGRAYKTLLPAFGTYASIAAMPPALVYAVSKLRGTKNK